MRVLEVRRHSLVKDHVHLSQAGVDLARRVGQTIGPFDLVYTSHITRTLETALAMGFAVTGQSDVPEAIVAEARAEFGHHERWSWERPFEGFARLVQQGGATARLGRAQADAWRAIVRALPEGGRALVISHGSIIEVGLVACFPRHDHAAWGPPFDKCEGARLTYQEDDWSALEQLRVGSALT
jgi:broad specificity phosphatase PhoE